MSIFDRITIYNVHVINVKSAAPVVIPISMIYENRHSCQQHVLIINIGPALLDFDELSMQNQ